MEQSKIIRSSAKTFLELVCLVRNRFLPEAAMGEIDEEEEQQQEAEDANQAEAEEEEQSAAAQQHQAPAFVAKLPHAALLQLLQFIVQTDFLSGNNICHYERASESLVTPCGVVLESRLFNLRADHWLHDLCKCFIEKFRRQQEHPQQQQDAEEQKQQREHQQQRLVCTLGEARAASGVESIEERVPCIVERDPAQGYGVSSDSLFHFTNTLIFQHTVARLLVDTCALRLVRPLKSHLSLPIYRIAVEDPLVTQVLVSLIVRHVTATERWVDPAVVAAHQRHIDLSLSRLRTGEEPNVHHAYEIHLLACAYKDGFDYANGRREALRAASIYGRIMGEDSLHVAHSNLVAAYCSHAAGKHLEALEMQRAALVIKTRAAGGDILSRALTAAYNNTALSMLYIGTEPLLLEAREVSQRAVRIHEQQSAERRFAQGVAFAEMNAARVCAALVRYYGHATLAAEAIRLARSAVRGMLACFDDERHAEVGAAHHALAEGLYGIGDFNGARDVVRQSIAVREAAFHPRGSFKVGESYKLLADVELALGGRDRDAVAHYRRAQEILSDKFFPWHHFLVSVYLGMAAAHERLGEKDDAVACLREAVQVAQQNAAMRPDLMLLAEEKLRSAEE